MQAMFGRIAHRYDRANSVLSLGIHHAWRRRAVKAASPANPVTTGQVLDVACGTGDLTFALAKAMQQGVVTGSDFTSEMLKVAKAKHAKSEAHRPAQVSIAWQQADAQDLPFDKGQFDAATIAFGIRNVDNPVQGLQEMHRVLTPGGRCVVLEFGQPSGAWGRLYRWYSRHVMPRLGGLITGDRAAYEYLPATAAAFPAGDDFLALMREAGPWSKLEAWPLTGGIAWVYLGVKADST